jgi:hypothetical protein
LSLSWQSTIKLQGEIAPLIAVTPNYSINTISVVIDIATSYFNVKEAIQSFINILFLTIKVVVTYT